MLVRRLVAGLAAMLVVPTVLVAAPSPSQAAPAGRLAHCIGTTGPTCRFWTGKVTFVADGDTIRVRLNGDATKRVYTIRFTGINATEMHVYSSKPSRWRGECNAKAATRFVYNLVNRAHGVVRIAAQDTSASNRGRPLRQVSLLVDGRWLDVGAAELAAGHALWMSNSTEWVWHRTYSTAALYARSHAKGMYSSHTCTSRPSRAAALSLSVRWDAPHRDADNVNGEWVRIRNSSAKRVPLKGWWLRDSSYIGRYAHGFTFPAGSSIAPHSSVTVHVGKGHRTATRFYFGLSAPIFTNATGAPRWEGDGGYLFDRHGNLRASSIYR